MNRAELLRTVGRGLGLAVLVVFLAGARWFHARLGGGVAWSDETTMALGFLFLTAFVAGRLATSLRLPMITGYLLAGIVVGPEALGLITRGTIENLALLNRLAIGLIAFIAGGELRPTMLRERGRAIGVMLVVEVALVLVLVAGVLLAFRPFVPFLADVPMAAAVVLALVFASVATVHSPSVTIALLGELRPRGPVTTTTLGIVVAADVLVVIMVTLSLSIAKALVGGGGLEAAFFLSIARELVGALVAGALAGALTDLYLRFIGAHLPIFIIFLALLGYEVAQAIHVEFMLFMLAAGFFVENVSPVDGGPLVRAVENVSLPAYALFFALAGASIHLTELMRLWPLALGVVMVRACGIWLGCRAGARLVRAEDAVRRYTWMGLISQAGVALGLVTVAARVLPEAGGAMRTLFLAMIAVHEVVGPVLFRTALARSGELGAAEAETQPVSGPYIAGGPRTEPLRP
ncbi:MAG TPA: cation:proton antiporter [Longimicrobiales bacterium]